MSDYITERMSFQINGIEFETSFTLEYLHGDLVDAELCTDDDTMETMFEAFNLFPYEIVLGNLSGGRIHELSREARYGKPNPVDHSASVKALEAMMSKRNDEAA